MDHLGAHLRQQLELEGIHERQEAGGGHEVRIGLQDAADVLEQLAAIGAQGNRQGDRRQVGATAAEGRQLAVGADSLEPGDDRHESVVEGRAQRPRQHAAHLRTQVRGGGPDAGLGTRERARRDAATLEPEGEERRRERLTGGERPVRLARQAGVGGLAGVPQRLAAVGQEHARRAKDRVGHALEGADHHHGPQAGGQLASNDIHGGRDVLRAAQDRSAELVDDDLRRWCARHAAGLRRWPADRPCSPRRAAAGLPPARSRAARRASG